MNLVSITAVPTPHQILVASDKQDASRHCSGERRFDFSDIHHLTLALQSGDEEAFRWLHAQWNMRLYRYCFVLARGDENLAREIVQATYIRLFRHIRELPDETALWNWLARAARSASLDLHRGSARYKVAIARLVEWFRPCSISTEDDTVEDGTDLLLLGLDRVLLRLDNHERALIEARYFENIPLEQIGKDLNISARAVEGRLARLRKRLRGLIAAELQQR